jgi:hypothetical protein
VCEEENRRKTQVMRVHIGDLLEAMSARMPVSMMGIRIGDVLETA